MYDNIIGYINVCKENVKFLNSIQNKNQMQCFNKINLFCHHKK